MRIEDMHPIGTRVTLTDRGIYRFRDVYYDRFSAVPKVWLVIDRDVDDCELPYRLQSEDGCLRLGSTFTRIEHPMLWVGLNEFTVVPRISISDDAATAAEDIL